MVKNDSNTGNEFLKNLDKKLWTAADKLREIKEHGFVLTPARDVGAEEVKNDGIPFADKMATLTAELAGQVTESAKLPKAIRENMMALGLELPVGGTK